MILQAALLCSAEDWVWRFVKIFFAKLLFWCHSPTRVESAGTGHFLSTLVSELSVLKRIIIKFRGGPAVSGQNQILLRGPPFCKSFGYDTNLFLLSYVWHWDDTYFLNCIRSDAYDDTYSFDKPVIVPNDRVLHTSPWWYTPSSCTMSDPSDTQLSRASYSIPFIHNFLVHQSTLMINNFLM